MFVRNTDTGKWSNQKDALSKDIYDNLRQDLEKVKLFSKCLSGSTYLPINSFENIYDTFDIKKIGYYIQNPYAANNTPLNGPLLPINQGNYQEFYTKYLKENAFSIKNLFTPNKLINDQLNNYIEVDVATTTQLDDIGQTNTNYTIDSVRLIEGHRLLVKDQLSQVTLASNINPEVYFSTTELVSEYFLETDNVTSRTYVWYNEQNGIYIYTDNKLVKTSELDTYEDAYRYSVVVKLGEINREKQFHLTRLKNGYYPVNSEGNNQQFVEKNNWVLRNRVDYNNIFDINYYDIIQHTTQSVYIQTEDRTYTIPPRTVVVGEFGVIINNQDKIYATSSHNQSHIISNKFKVNIRSIDETDNYYWCCGDEGTLLKVWKHNFEIERIELDETSNLNSISFFNNLYGKIVGDFNTIWWTKDGGLKWNKLVVPEFDKYSFNKVVYYDLNKTYVGGDVGVFIEFDYINGTWLSYKRKVAKQLNELDEYILIEDINDMIKTDWNRIVTSNSIKDSSLVDFGENLIYKNYESNDFNGISPTYSLTIELDSQYFGLSTFSASQFFGAIQVEDEDGNIVYTNINFGSPLTPSTTYDFYLYSSSFVKEATVDLPKDINDNLLNKNFKVNVELYYNYNALTNSLGGFNIKTYDYIVETKKGNMLLLACNNSTVICYDINRLITNSNNQFIYFTPTQSFSDVRSISRENYSTNIYVSGDKVYDFKFDVFLNSGTVSNDSTGQYNLYLDKYINKLLFNEDNDNPYIIGNNSLSQFANSSTFMDLDPTFNSRLKSRFLFLDYDVASKLNFFTDDGEYRLPQSVTFSNTSFTQSFVLKNVIGETNWIDYYKDAEKTFRYYSSISDLDKVEFSTTFSYFERRSSYTINPSSITSNVNEILPLAPSITSSTFSRFIQQTTPISTQYTTNYDLLLNKYLLIFKLSLSKASIENGASPNIGDVLRITSDVIDCNLVINRLEAYLYDSAILNDPRVNVSWPTTLTTSSQRIDLYCYCYSDFNENIIRNLQNVQVSIENLNKYESVDNLVERFELHPVSIGYKMETDGIIVTVSPRFNNKTAYYNLQATALLGVESKDLLYQESFLDFGYTPTYNILDYLEKLDNRFTPSYEFTIMPQFYGLPANGNNSFTSSNIFIDLSTGLVTGTNSYYRGGSNQIIFGEDFKFHWESLLIHTFVDLTISNSIGNSYTTDRLLITSKYYRSDINGYVMEFHKKIEIPNNITNTFVVSLINIESRLRLDQISSDLQLLNNIQRSSLVKSVQNLQTFTSLENELISKFPTDSYLKVLASDYNIREFVSAAIYTDNNYQIAMNLFNVEEERTYGIRQTIPRSINGLSDMLQLYMNSTHELEVGDLVEIVFTGGTGSSETINPQYFGLHTVIESVRSNILNYIVISVPFGTGSLTGYDEGTITHIKKDPFFNYIPIDLFDLGSDKKLSKAIEVKPENYILNLNKYNLENVDLNNYRYILTDGLSLEELSNKFSWILEAEISDAIIGRDENGGLVWYSGTWHCGRWFGGTWYSGRWVSGDWYKGTWNAFNTNYKVISVIVDDSFVDNSASKWFGGRWFEGTWGGGTWYYGRRYSGEWKTGIWYDGIWNDGTWLDGRFEGGVWVLGTWEGGIFNCDSKPAYFLDGIFRSGDFENGIWYNGQFGNDKGKLSRFGTKSTNSRTSLWHAGKWIDGEFHSFLNTNSSTGLPDISDIHKYSIWRTGIWLKGNFYGGIAYNIDFKSGNWYGGILEEIQVIGVDPILPATTSTNSITVNGIFKFNPGDQIWIIDDDKNGAYSPLGNNDDPKRYRINKIEEYPDIEQTKIYLNFNLSSLGVNTTIATQSYSNVETGLRVVSYFKDSYWKSGIWTNGIFEGGQFDTGIWYNGVFNGTWGN